jgi:hypothetical protein
MTQVFSKLIFFYLVLTAFSSIASSQEIRRQSIKFGVGPGISDGIRTTGGGMTFSTGYSRSLKNDRFRINPNLSFGLYSARFVMDVRDQYFNSINLETNVSADLIRFHGISLTAYAGPCFNNTRGLLGTGGWPPSESRSEYSSEYSLMFSFGGGIRILPPGKRVGVELFPLNFRLGKNDILEAMAKISFDIGLSK